MNNMARGFSYLIAAQVQSVGLCLVAWWVGDWANHHHPLGFSWYVITFPIAVLAIGQTFYVVIRTLFRQNKKPAS